MLNSCNLFTRKRTLFDGFQHPTRIPHSHHIRRNVTGNNTSRTDDATLPDADARTDSNIACDPAVVADGDRLRIFAGGQRAIGFRILVAFLPAQRVHWCEDRHIRTKEYIFADDDWRTVKAREVEVRIGVFADLRIDTIIEENGSLQINALPAVSE